MANLLFYLTTKATHVLATMVGPEIDATPSSAQLSSTQTKGLSGTQTNKDVFAPSLSKTIQAVILITVALVLLV
jgi:hypothetical protein